METIKMLSDYIADEIGDSMKYAEAALKYREDNSTLADLFNRLSEEEFKHMDLLHNAIVKELEKMQASYKK